MTLPIVFGPEAQEEMDEAYSWYERQRTGLGEEFLAAVRDVLNEIQEHPEIYQKVYRSVRRGNTHRFPYGVYYRVRPDRIEVAAVFHGRRNPRIWKARA